MKEMITERGASIKLEKSSSRTNDLLSDLVKELEEVSHPKSQARTGLTESEIMGNLFAVTIAGHESSANSIHFSLILLGLNFVAPFHKRAR